MTLRRVDGSFRDSSGHVYVHNDNVYRVVTSVGAKKYQSVRDLKLFEKSIHENFLIESHEIPYKHWPCIIDDCIHLIHHKKIPFLSYPYEWSFDQLKSAALHHLDFQLMLIKNGAVLIDGSAYNIQFIGSRPVFIDLLSIAPYEDGQIWTGHQQFCSQFLNPLILMSKCHIPYNSWYRGDLEGIRTNELYNILPLKEYFSLETIKHVILPAIIQKQMNKRPNIMEMKILKTPVIEKNGYIDLLLRLRDFIDCLKVRNKHQSTWSDYEANNSYSEESVQSKINIVTHFISTYLPNTLLELGCNAGFYGRLCIEAGAKYVVGIDNDNDSLDKAFNLSRDNRILYHTLLIDASNPSPDMGWMQRERLGFDKRFKFDAVIALAFVHHLAFTKNIPLEEIIKWILSRGQYGLIEYVPISDPKVIKMISGRSEIFKYYSEEKFRSYLSSYAQITKRSEISGSGRVIYEFSKIK